MAQATARRRAQDRRVQRRRQNQITLLIGIGAGALVIAVILIFVSWPRTITPAVSVDYNGLQQDIVPVGQANGFAVGDPNAPATLVEFSDFSCPHCAAVAPAIHELINTYAVDGRLRVIYMPMKFLSERSVTAASAAVCASEQGQFWQMHDEIWDIYQQAGPAGYTQADLIARADNIGLDKSAFSSCLASSRAQPLLAAISNEFDSRGLSGTPSIFLNNEFFVLRSEQTVYEDVSAQIEVLLNQQP